MAMAGKCQCKYLKSFKGDGTPPFELHPDTHIVIESDVYRLIFNSQLPSAEKFQDWVMDEVLPSIKKHGFYGTEDFVSRKLRQLSGMRIRPEP